jgi:hypothetical protein
MSIYLLFSLRCRVFLLSSISIFGLLGCVGRQSAVYETAKAAFEDKQSLINKAPLNPQYRYKFAEVDGRPALLVLGYIDKANQSPIETWYSANQELIQFQNDRLISTAGLDVNWMQVHYDWLPVAANQFNPEIEEKGAIPSIAQIVQKKSIQEALPRTSTIPLMVYQRTRTVMPGYRAQISEIVFLERLDGPPAQIASKDRENLNSGSIYWVQERVVPKINDPHNPGFISLPAYYAIDISKNPAQVVYGRQCLVSDYCLSWQVWPRYESTGP